MGRRIDSIMQGTIRTLKNMDVAMAKSIFQKDVEINTMEKSIEQSCMNLLALQQPLARDLRVITATLKVITDMERISDQCADICEILATVAGISVMNTSPRMIQMFEKAREMVAGAVDAYIRRTAGRPRPSAKRTMKSTPCFLPRCWSCAARFPGTAPPCRSMWISCSSPNISNAWRITPPISRNGRFSSTPACIPTSTIPRPASNR